MEKVNQGTFVAWERVTGRIPQRCQGFVDSLDMIPVYIKKSALNHKILLPLRYLMFFMETLCRLFIEKPAYIIVTSPPIFAIISVYLYAILTKTPFYVDNHSGAFESRKWKWSIPILRIICQRANSVLVTNNAHFELVKSWKANPIIVGDPPPVIPEIPQEYSVELTLASPSIVVVNTYSKNEALEEIIDAAKLCAGVTFHITGDKRKAGREILDKLPRNVILTGWLEELEFWRLMNKCNLVLTLINQENTILRGSWEAMYLGQPLITSDTVELCNYFHKGAVFVSNDGRSIAEGINHGLKNEMELRAKMEELRLERTHEWEEQKNIFIGGKSK